MLRNKWFRPVRHATPTGLWPVDTVWRKNGKTGDIVLDKHQLSVHVLVWALHQYANEGLILSLCNGTGSAQVAALLTGHPSLGFDNDQYMMECAVTRINELRLLVGDESATPQPHKQAKPTADAGTAAEEAGAAGSSEGAATDTTAGANVSRQQQMLDDLLAWNNGAIALIDPDKYSAWKAAILEAPDGRIVFLEAKLKELKEHAASKSKPVDMMKMFPLLDNLASTT
jgi:hypothetical protein